jgi:cytochrome c
MKYLSAFAFLAAAMPAMADGHSGSGDPAAGEKAFRQCQSCHVVKNDAGETLAGKNGRTGPNLFGVIGREAGTLDGFKYRKSIKAAGEAGLVWDAENLAAYVQNPTGFLRDFLNDSKAKSGMGFKVRKEEDAANLAAFLASFTAP